jgi:hypothetical protein
MLSLHSSGYRPSHHRVPSLLRPSSRGLFHFLLASRLSRTRLQNQEKPLLRAYRWPQDYSLLPSRHNRRSQSRRQSTHQPREVSAQSQMRWCQSILRKNLEKRCSTYRFSYRVCLLMRLNREMYHRSRYHYRCRRCLVMPLSLGMYLARFYLWFPQPQHKRQNRSHQSGRGNSYLKSLLMLRSPWHLNRRACRCRLSLRILRSLWHHSRHACNYQTSPHIPRSPWHRNRQTCNCQASLHILRNLWHHECRACKCQTSPHTLLNQWVCLNQRHPNYPRWPSRHLAPRNLYGQHRHRCPRCHRKLPSLWPH